MTRNLTTNSEIAMARLALDIVGASLVLAGLAMLARPFIG